MDKYRILVKGIVRSEDKFLVVRKWYDDRIAEPYQWEFVDGMIEFMEAPDKAVIRIISEQTGISATLDKILYTWSFVTGDVFNIGICYLCITPIDAVIMSEELNNYQWIKKEEFGKYIDDKILEDIERSELLT